MTHSLHTRCAVLAGALAAWPLVGAAQAVAPEMRPAPPQMRDLSELRVEAPLLAQVSGSFDVLVDSAFDRAAVGLGGDRLVKGAPYCAEAIH
jgi:hypothetical protein